jgi:hypothetical protein
MVVLSTAAARTLFRSQFLSTQEGRFDFLVTKTGAGFIFVLGKYLSADQAHQNRRGHGWNH